MASVINELRNKTNEEIASLVFKIKIQLMQLRFAQAAGTLDKPNTFSELRRVVALAKTVLTERNAKVTFGEHGATLYDNKNGTVVSLNEQFNKVVNETNSVASEETPVDKKEAKKAKKESKLLAKKKLQEAKKVGSQVAYKKAAIRKTQGGGK
ncbi:MAG: 50S ribosomal protein L29 [Mycoplasmataceae bacterium]|jgi:ribosomal protein L29|nr:50S ribosomal protein L29 [Mycoplasmataceae bacterium]